MTPVERFQRLLRIPTVSHPDESLVDWARFDEFVDALRELYPRTHETLAVERVAGHSLLYRWAGREPGDPVVLMAHMDVVPAVPDEWDRPPFAAEIVGEGSEARIHARGTIDNKGALVAILEAVEQLVTEGFEPQHDVHLAFGHNEEVDGDGARSMAARLAERGVRPWLVLDEGGAVVEGVLPGLRAPAAMIGVAERGTAAVTLTATEAGGHSSTPPRFPATARLARAIGRVHRRPFPTHLARPVRAMLATLAPHVDGPLGTALRHPRLTGPVLRRALPALGPELNALVRTTAVVTQLSGSAADNVLATAPSATLDLRLLTGDTVAGALERLRRVVADDGVRVELRDGTDPSPVSPWRGPRWMRLARAVVEALGADVVPTPYLQLAASDSRFFAGISDHVYRFTPFLITEEEREALHAADERIGVETWLRGIGFYRALLEAS